jgi:lipopolysaccharide biosynthesis protein
MMITLRKAFRIWRREMKAAMPYVRRREYRMLQNKYHELTSGLASNPPLATVANITSIKHVTPAINGEVCFFVTFAERSELKRHVQWHINQLLQAGIHVVLVINTELPHERFTVSPELLSRLDGAYVRQNVGFDFAAWAHLFALCGERSNWARLYLVNDSIVGPVDASAFDRIIERVRTSPADFVGLTENTSPVHHIQSYFLAFNAGALRSTVLQNWFHQAISFPSKQMVIDIYELNLTRTLMRSGLTVETLFPSLAKSQHDTNDTDVRWDALLRSGFPYVKTSVLKKMRASKLVMQLIPQEFQNPEA